MAPTQSKVPVYIATTLLGIIAFFCSMCYYKFDRMSEDITTIKINGAVQLEKVTGIERRVQSLEDINRINYPPLKKIP